MYLATRRRTRDRIVSTPQPNSGYSISRYKRFWQVTDAAGRLVCLTVYRRGAKEVVRRLSA
jgi:hypothetical protein